MRPFCLDELLPPGHDALTISYVVASWDLGRFTEALKARGDRAGRAATDPRILIALWLYPATRGVASARELDLAHFGARLVGAESQG
jgi:transposase